MKKSTKISHIILIIVGIIFISLGAFHNNLWFDETYSVGLVNHNFAEIWEIGGNDVHPILYYFMLKVINLIFGQNLIAYRLLSVAGIAILGILGFTHIRKDFGEKTGILFSLFTFFLPIMAIYASEIRMYSWAIVFITLTAIYGYRLTKENKVKNWILFGIFSLLSLYIHYYGVMAAGIINIALFIYFMRRKDIRGKYLPKFLIAGFAQFALYLPWIFNFIKQLKNVAGGFWISFEFPGTLFNVFQFQYVGNLDARVGLIFGYTLFLFAWYLFKKSKKENEDVKPGKWAICIYFAVILAALVLSLKTPILYPRYLFTITGLLIFFLSYFFAKQKNTNSVIILCAILIGLSIISNVRFIDTNYYKNNTKPIEYLTENIKEDDIIVYQNPELGTGSVAAVNFLNTKQYFYNSENWNVEKAYQAYAPNMEIITSLDSLKDYKGRIWILDSSDYRLSNEILSKYNATFVSTNKFETKYQNYCYNVILLEK